MADLTEGSIPRHIMYMAVPTMSGLLLQGFYDLVDMIWIGRISYEAVAAVTIYVSIFWIFEVVNEVIGMSSVSLISQSFGAGDSLRVQKTAEQTITCKFLVSVAAALALMISLEPLLRLFTSDPVVISHARSYGYLRTLFIPIFFSSFSVNTIFRCTGDAKTPMYLLVVSAVVNMILDPVLMFDTIPGLGIPGFGLGVFGAALATVISISIAFLAGFFLLLLGKAQVKITWRGMCTLDREIDRKLLTVGLPSGFEMLFRNSANSLLVKLVGFYGTAAIALIGVGMRIYSFIFMPILGIVMGSGAIAGQNLGANHIDRAVRTAWFSSLIGGAVTAVFVFFVMVFPDELLGLFLTDLQEVAQGAIMLRVVVPSLIIAAISLGWASVFSGSGYTMPFLVSCITAKWIIMIPYTAVIIYVFQAPLSAVWYCFFFGEAAEMLVLGMAFKRGKWKIKRV